MERIDRRRFVAALSGGLVAASAGASASGKVPRITLGRTRLKVPCLALGTTQPPDRVVLAYCLEQGLNFIDTAPNYANGRSEEILGRRFGELDLERGKLILASKNKSRDPSQWPKLIAESCKRLATDYLDIFYAHSIGGREQPPSDSTKWLLRPEVERAVAELKRSGQIRFFAYSVHVTNRAFVNELIRESAKGDHVDIVMVRYNFREYGNRELAESLEIAHKAGQGVITIKSQAGAKAVPDQVKPFLGSGFNHWQAAIRWVASNPHVHVVCTNIRTLQMARENIAAIKQPRLSARECERLMLYARATSTSACRMCTTCLSACAQGIAISDILRAVMYCDDYGDEAMGRQTYSEIDSRWRAGGCEDCGACERVCPNGLPIRRYLARAAQVFEKTHGGTSV